MITQKRYDPLLMETEVFSTVFTRALHLSLCRTTLIQST